MQPTFTEIKYAARSSLKHRWPEAMAVSLVFIATSLLNVLTQYMLMTVFKVKDVWTPFTPTDVPMYSQMASIGITLFSAVFSLIVMFPLIFGVIRWFWLVTGGSDPALNEIFHYFSSSKVFFKTMALSIGLYLRLVVGAIVCFSPYIAMGVLTTPDLYDRLGITMPVVMESLRPLVSFSKILGFIVLLLWISTYALCYTVVFSEPELTAHRTVRRTVEVTRGFRFNSVCFAFSFFGWAIACLLVLPVLFVMPYFLSSIAIYGREIYRTSKHGATADR